MTSVLLLKAEFQQLMAVAPATGLCLIQTLDLFTALSQCEQSKDLSYLGDVSHLRSLDAAATWQTAGLLP